jgi:hypothetical protein
MPVTTPNPVEKALNFSTDVSAATVKNMIVPINLLAPFCSMLVRHLRNATTCIIAGFFLL